MTHCLILMLFVTSYLARTPLPKHPLLVLPTYELDNETPTAASQGHIWYFIQYVRTGVSWANSTRANISTLDDRSLKVATTSLSRYLQSGLLLRSSFSGQWTS